MLRVGIVLDSYVSSAWVAKTIEDIQSSGFARVELVVLDMSSGQSNAPLKTRLRNCCKSLLFRFYERWDYRQNKTDDDAMAPTDVSRLLNAVPSIFVRPNREVLPACIPQRELAEMRNHNLDVLLCFGPCTPREGLVSAARCGVWSLHLGGSCDDRLVPPLFWELFERNPVSESTLQIFKDAPGDSRIIYQSYASTDQTSLYRNRNPIYWKTSEFALRRLRDLHLNGIESIQSVAADCEQDISIRAIRRPPNSLQMVLFTVDRLVRSLRIRVASMRSGARTKWYLALRSRSATHCFDDPANYRLMMSPPDRFYADPFLIEKDGETFLFFEDFRFANNRAVISYCKLAPDGTPGAVAVALSRPYHLSYPFVFEDEGEMYMIPETRGNRTVELYRATTFPSAWIEEAVLMSSANVVDATIQKINGKYWMFAGVSNGKYSGCDELGIFFADALKGPWTPHPRNPLLSDVRRARPAGKLFYEGGRLIRPSQDCAKAYGYALVFSEVLILSETEYEERPIGRIDPDLVAACTNTHTYNRTGQFEVVDRTLPARVAAM